MNPQSSRPSVALGAVPTAPKPAPNPITTNMPQFGSAPGLTNADGVPTLPPVSPGMTQPLTPAPNPTPAPAPTSAMPQYMNAANTNMIPVVNQPLDVNKVPDTPAEQYNPFSSMPAAGKTSPQKSSGSHTLNLILGLLTALFVIAAVIFFILWQNAANNPKVIPMPSTPTPGQSADDNQPENQPTDPDQSLGQARHLSCRGTSELTEADLAAGMTGNSSVYDVYYAETDPTEIRVTSVAGYNSPEAAAAVYAEASSETMAYLTGIFASIGIDISTDDFKLDNNTVSATFIVPAAKLLDPEADMLSRQMLAGTLGFPFDYGEDGASFVIHTELDAVRANYESAGLACEVAE